MRFAAKPADTKRPTLWHQLADDLLAEGWLFDASRGEWVLPTGDEQDFADGDAHARAHPDRHAHICWAPADPWGDNAPDAPASRAWLRHPYGGGESHHIEA